MDFDTPLPPPTSERIAFLENSFEVRFPADYRRFLETANGATPRPRTFDSTRGERLVERFLPILNDPSSDDANGWADVAVVATQLDSRLAVDEDATGMSIVPIAALFAGDFAVLDFRADRAHPGVAVWDHERSDDFAPVLERISPDFTSFLAALK